jgi:ectoine hydroxylase-related dioxygenase (phytanoyl-CoA dioxygenase family)
LHPYFHHPDLQQSYEKMGFVIVDLFSPETAAKLSKFYEDLNAETNHGFHSTLHHNSTDYRKRVMNEILFYVQEPLSNILLNHRIITCSFVVKEADPNSQVILHQDWNLTNEQTFPGFNVWVSLTDTDINNGALHLLPGSHRLPPTQRGTGLPDPCKSLQTLSLGQIFCAATKAGQAVIYDVRTLHASPPNLSSSKRIACAIGSVHADANLLHHHYTADDQTFTTCQVGADFYINYQPHPEFFHQLPVIHQAKRSLNEFTQFAPADIQNLLNPPPRLKKWWRFFAK